VKGPGSELARFVLADSLLGANGPGSEKSRYPSFLSIRLLGGLQPEWEPDISEPRDFDIMTSPH